MTKVFKLIYIFISFIVVTLVILYFYLNFYLNQNVRTSKLVYIPKGSTKNALLYLKKSGVDINFIDYYIVKYIGYPQAGWIDLNKTILTRKEFLYKITKSKAALQKITLIPGDSKELFFSNLSRDLDLNSSKLLKAYNNYAPYSDGVLFSDTYSVPVGIKEDALIHYLVDSSLKKHKNISLKLLQKYNQEEWFKKYVTIASIIIKEAGSKKEMFLVSAVIRNRLKKGMKLQMDGTLNYKYQSHKRVTAKMLKEDNSKYNTYKKKGLPPNPICSVNYDAIYAAINPANVDYLYFVKLKNGTHGFSKSYTKHLKKIKMGK